MDLKDKEVAEKKLMIASAPLIHLDEAVILLDTSLSSTKQVWNEAKKLSRTANGVTESARAKFNNRLLKTWAVFQAAGLDRDETIASLRSALK